MAGRSPIGKRLKPNFNGAPWCTVVGVAGDVRHWGTDVDIEPTAYYPYTQIPDTIRPLLEANMGIATRSAQGEADLLHAIRAAVADVDKNLPVYEVKTMDSMGGFWISAPLRFFAAGHVFRPGAGVSHHRSVRSHGVLGFTAH